MTAIGTRLTNRWTKLSLLAMKTVNIHEAKTHLSGLLVRVRQGEEIVIAKDGEPIARLVPLRPKSARRVLGRDRGRVVIAKDFDAPLPDAVLRTFEE